MIRKATEADIDRLLKLTQACAKQMVSRQIFQWNEHYPNRKAFETDVERQELYVLEKNEQIIGCIVVSTYMDQDYSEIEWLTENENNLYIHRLAIDPNFQGMGYAQKLMDFAESYAAEHHFRSLRLDTFSQNHRNQKFYERRAYKRLGNVYFPKQSEFPFYCYELVL